MDAKDMEALLRNLDRRMTVVEQILPTLPTRDEMQRSIQEAVAPLATKAELDAAVARLATKEELQAAIAPLATKAEVREEGERTRRHFDVVAERLHVDIKLIAEGHVALARRIEDVRTQLEASDARLDERVTRLEASLLPHGRRRRR